jgi:putative ABC transport system permease protein
VISHYLTVAVRDIRRAPLLTAVNVSTLALGLACFVTAYAAVAYWDHSEQHFENANRTVVITSDITVGDGSFVTGVIPRTSASIAQYLTADFPEIEVVARAGVMNDTVMVSTGERAARAFGVWVDPEFLDIFDMTYVARDGENPLRRPRSIVLTEETAERLFGIEDPIGRNLVIGNVIDATVTGVIEPIPEPSHLGRSIAATLRFELLASRDVIEAIAATYTNLVDQSENWGFARSVTYALLPEDGLFTAEVLRERLHAFTERHLPDRNREATNLELGVIPISDIMLANMNARLFQVGGGVTIPGLLLLLGGMVLAVACVNYANLATARAAGRTKEVGMRKVVGARRRQVMGQYLFEAGIHTTAALLIGILAVLLIVPVMQAAVGIDLRISMFSSTGFWLFLVGLIVSVTVISGAYPAFVLSRVRPVRALGVGKMRLGPRFLSTSLVGLQFFLASFLLIAFLVVYAQNGELRRTGLGATIEPILMLEADERMTGITPDELQERLLAIPGVTAATAAESAPWIGYIPPIDLARAPGEYAVVHRTTLNTVGMDFFSTLGVEIIAGRAFDREHRDDSASWSLGLDPSRPINVVLDIAAAEGFGFVSAEEAVGQTVYIPERLMGAYGRTAAQPLEVIGVVNNAQLHLLGGGASSGIYAISVNNPWQILRLSTNDIQGTLAAIDDLWRSLAPNVSINRRFLDEAFEEIYENFGRLNQVSSGLALFAFLISTVGLFAMAIQIASRRVREIGIRKTLGASTNQVLAMLLKDFSKPVLIGNLLAWPIAYLAAQAYLNMFIQRISLTMLPFISSIAIALLIAWIAVAGQAIRTARVRPAQMIRYE